MATAVPDGFNGATSAFRCAVVHLTTGTTELMTADNAIVGADDWYRAIVRSSLDGMIIIDAASGIVEFSPAAEEIFGYTREEAVGRSIVDLLIPGRAKDLSASSGQLSQRSEVVVIHDASKLANGRGEEFERRVPQRTQSERELRHATQQLREALSKAQAVTRAKSEFLANISHEIRAPMTAIAG